MSIDNSLCPAEKKEKDSTTLVSNSCNPMNCSLPEYSLKMADARDSAMSMTSSIQAEWTVAVTIAAGTAATGYLAYKGF